MMFRFKNAPEPFQRTMNLMLGDLVDKYVPCLLRQYTYLLYIMSIDHEEHICLVFEQLA